MIVGIPIGNILYKAKGNDGITQCKTGVTLGQKATGIILDLSELSTNNYRFNQNLANGYINYSTRLFKIILVSAQIIQNSLKCFMHDARLTKMVY